MTFASLSAATHESLRKFEATQNSLNLIQNSMVSKEIHDQGSRKSYKFILIIFPSRNIILLGVCNFNNDSAEFESSFVVITWPSFY